MLNYGIKNYIMKQAISRWPITGKGRSQIEVIDSEAGPGEARAANCDDDQRHGEVTITAEESRYDEEPSRQQQT